MLDRACILSARTHHRQILGRELASSTIGPRRVRVLAGTELNNRYSANVVDICLWARPPNGIFVLRRRVWYLSCQRSAAALGKGATSIYITCSTGPLSTTALGVVRVKPRYNPDVNGWWICDEVLRPRLGRRGR